MLYHRAFANLQTLKPFWERSALLCGNCSCYLLHAPEKHSVDPQVKCCDSRQLAYSFTSLSTFNMFL